MKHVNSFFLVMVMIACLNFQPVLASQTESTNALNGEVLCLPGVYPLYQQDCLLEGPAGTLSDLAAVGITFPPVPLPLSSPPTDLSVIPYYYARVNDGPAPLYNYLPSEPGMTPTRILDGSLRYISYIQRMETNAGLFYQFGTGEWIDGGNVARAAPPDFQGFLIGHPLPHPFGWILTTAVSRTLPGYSAPETGQSYNRFNIVSIYESLTVDGVEWCRIGVNEWIEKRMVARIIPNLTPPDGVGNGRWIEINLYEQTLMVYDQSQLIFATLVSTGFDPFFTQPGLFQIYDRMESETMSGSFEADHADYYYLEDVPFTMYFDQARALHGAYWHSIFGYARSHGCVNLSISDSHWLYNWAQIGDWVYVWDPSGATPTDPAYYGQGGA